MSEVKFVVQVDVVLFPLRKLGRIWLVMLKLFDTMWLSISPIFFTVMGLHGFGLAFYSSMDDGDDNSWLLAIPSFDEVTFCFFYAPG